MAEILVMEKRSGTMYRKETVWAMSRQLVMTSLAWSSLTKPLRGVERRTMTKKRWKSWSGRSDQILKSAKFIDERLLLLKTS